MERKPTAVTDPLQDVPADLLGGWNVPGIRRLGVGVSGADLLTRAVEPIARRVFLVTSPGQLRRHSAPASFGAGFEMATLPPVAGEPDAELIDALAERLRAHRRGNEPVAIVALGGGSVIDAAKALAALAPQPAGVSARSLTEVTGPAEPLRVAPLPVIAIPTTAGTGAEATRNAVIRVDLEAGPVKSSIRDPRLMPRVALVDPAHLRTCPPAVLAASGLDAVVQLLESAISGRSPPPVAEIALAALPRALRALRTLMGDWSADPSGRSHAESAVGRLPVGETAEPSERLDRARVELARAAFLSGVTLTHGGLGLAHGLAAPLGARFQVAHGVAVALLAPAVFRWNVDRAPERCARAAVALLAGMDRADVSRRRELKRAAEALAELVHGFGLPTRLSEVGVAAGDFAWLAGNSHGNSRRGNPAEIPDDELARLLEELR
jgi:alcohol dehydrogenase class IV